MKLSLPGGLLLILAFMPVHHTYSAPHIPTDSAHMLDQQTEEVLDLISRAELKQARVLARQLAAQFPNYALGQLLSAELESAAAFKPLMAADSAPMSQTLVNLLLEAKYRLNERAKEISVANRLPSEIIQVGAHIKQLLMVDLQQSNLQYWVTSHGVPTLVRQHYVSSGKAGFGKQVEGDHKTPLGIYAINGLLSDQSLPDLYGSGALTLNYPNALDKHLGRTGSGIWLHGIPHAWRSRAPRSSEGCVTMSNDHMLTLKQHLAPEDTVVVLSHNLEWEDEAVQSARRQQFRELFRQYQRAWTHRDKSRLLALYEAPKQFLERLDQAHGMHKVTAGSTKADLGSSDYLTQLALVQAEDISLYLNPSLSTRIEQEMLVMEARFGTLSEVQLTVYWAKGRDGKWRIVTDQREGLDT